jgi:hypothetical protein
MIKTWLGGSLFNYQKQSVEAVVMGQPPEAQARLIPAEDVDRRYGVVEQAGCMGKIFGSATTPPIGITGIIALLFTLASIIVLFVPSNIPADDYIKIVLPVISVMAGYLFGKST